MVELNEVQLERYQRNILLGDIGRIGQEKLLSSRVLVVGAGGLGSPVLLYLAAAGVGNIGVIDGDTVELSNLQRQIIHGNDNLGQYKVFSAKKRMLAINPDLRIQALRQLFTRENGEEIVRQYDFVVDATDNFAAKFLINDICVSLQVPFSHGGILEYSGQVMTVLPGISCCYRCVFKAAPPPETAIKCSLAGVLGAVAGITGSIQATETIKYLTGSGELLTDTLLTVDARTMKFRQVQLRKKQTCPACGVVKSMRR